MICDTVITFVIIDTCIGRCNNGWFNNNVVDGNRSRFSSSIILKALLIIIIDLSFTQSVVIENVDDNK